tara:strand:+ start:9448 stop:11031 length:1584 start_codon:yes stop_codon:yes gene_type:complete
MKLKVAILVDNLKIKKWQKLTLENALGKIDIVFILNCKNTLNKRNILKNLFYYFINYFSLKNEFTKKYKLIGFKGKIIEFNSDYRGHWQSIPKSVTKKLKSQNVNLIIKFGMNLLKIDKNTSGLTILSFHHGNPSKYRGRPAGFYEILNNEKNVGSIVQSITNKLDAGKIYAFSESKIINYSYKKTAINFYSNSRFLLSKAIENFLKKKQENINKNGINYKLPSNYKVLKFLSLIFYNLIKKIFYGIFFEKKWRIAVIDSKLRFEGDETLLSKNFKKIPITKKYSRYADPFFSHDYKNIRLEAINKNANLGEIISIPTNNLKKQKLLFSKNHYSYPFSFVYKKIEYLLPEVSSHSAPFFIEIDRKYKKKHFLRGFKNQRIVDSTLFKHKNFWYLFFGKKNDATNVLHLWISESPFKEFKPHPNTPITISPKSARMGGNIFCFNKRIFRFGQNNEGEYGESLSVIEIKNLTPKNYLEEFIGSIKIDKHKGPHTINFNEKTKKMIFDFYDNKFSLFAGFRRIKTLLKRF